MNLVDLLTKYNLTKDTPESWLTMQQQLLSGMWLQDHPRTWLADVQAESQAKIKLQAS